MKSGVYGLLKARFLIDDQAVKNWGFISFIVFLAILIIGNTQSYERKVYEIAALTSDVKELRSEFVELRSELMELKMESTISEKMKERGIFPSDVPPVKIRVKEKKKEGFF